MRGGIPPLPVNLTLAKIPVLPHCLGGHLPWSSGVELPRTKMSHRFTKRLLPLTRNLFFVLVPAACARGSLRCFEASAVRPLWEGLTREGLGSRPTPYVQPRRFMNWEGAANGILAQSPKARSAVRAAISIRPTFSCPVSSPQTAPRTAPFGARTSLRRDF